MASHFLLRAQEKVTKEKSTQMSWPTAPFVSNQQRGSRIRTPVQMRLTVHPVQLTLITNHFLSMPYG